MSETGMLPNIVSHSLQVCHVAALLAEHLEKGGIKLDQDLVCASALLHDITKTRCLKTGEKHDLSGSELILRMGYPEVAYIIGRHVVLETDFQSDKPAEVEIVNYADKRVLHDRIVSLRARMDDIIARYAKHPIDKELICQNWLRVEKIEKKLFGFLPFPPEELHLRIGSDVLPQAIKEYHALCAEVSDQPLSISFDEFPSIKVDCPI